MEFLAAKLFSFSCMHAKSLHSCPTLCNPMACSPPGSSIHGILQARILEWVAMPSFMGSSQPRDQTQGSLMFPTLAGRFLPLAPPGKPLSIPTLGQRPFSVVCVMFPKGYGGSSDFWKRKTLPLLLSSTDSMDSHSLPSWQVPWTVAPEILSYFSLSNLEFLELDHKLA